MPTGRAPAPQPILSSPITSSQTSTTSDSLYARFILTPLLAISFILSLVLIDRRTSAIICNHKHDTNCKHGAACHHDEYYHSHQRKLARQEMDGAEKLRGKVVLGLLAITGVGLVTAGWGMVLAWGRWMAAKVVGEV